MPWDPFLMKKFVKSEVCGTHEQCIHALFTTEKSKHAAGKKKGKKKERNANMDPRWYLGSVWIQLKTEKHYSKIILNVWIVPWDPFLMKKLLKSEICGSVNSARCALIGWKLFDKSKFVATVYEQCMNSSCNSLKTREKKMEKRKGKRFQPNPNVLLISNFSLLYLTLEKKVHHRLCPKNKKNTCSLPIGS